MERTNNKIEITPADYRMKYREEYARMGYEIALLCGASDRDLARIFDVTPGTIQRWKREQPQFVAEIERGKELADGKVVAALIERCLGYEHDEVDIKMYKDISTGKGVIVKTPIIKHYPPDVAAIKFWLTNRQKDNWTETTRVEKNTNIHLHRDLPLDDVTTEELSMAERLGMKKLLKDMKNKN